MKYLLCFNAFVGSVRRRITERKPLRHITAPILRHFDIDDRELYNLCDELEEKHHFYLQDISSQMRYTYVCNLYEKIRRRMIYNIENANDLRLR